MCDSVRRLLNNLLVGITTLALGLRSLSRRTVHLSVLSCTSNTVLVGVFVTCDCSTVLQTSGFVVVVLYGYSTVQYYCFVSSLIT